MMTTTRTSRASNNLTGSCNSILLNYWQKKALKIHHLHWSVQILSSSAIFLWWLTLILLISSLISDDEDRDVGLFIVLPPDMAGSPENVLLSPMPISPALQGHNLCPICPFSCYFLISISKVQTSQNICPSNVYIHFITVHTWFTYLPCFVITNYSNTGVLISP
jgi:hypothetical protein